MSTSENELRNQLEHYGQLIGIWAVALTIPCWMLAGVIVEVFRNFVGGNPKTVDSTLPIICLVIGFGMAGLISAIGLWYGDTGRRIKEMAQQLNDSDKASVVGQAAKSAAYSGFIGICLAAGMLLAMMVYLFLFVLMCFLPFIFLL